MAKRKTVGSSRNKTQKAKPAAKAIKRPTAASSGSDESGVAADVPVKSLRLLPTGDELKTLYQRYTNGAAFDDHDKAFYFVLDVGGLSRAKQLLAHVEEVLAELEEIER